MMSSSHNLGYWGSIYPMIEIIYVIILKTRVFNNPIGLYFQYGDLILIDNTIIENFQYALTMYLINGLSSDVFL